MDPLDEIKYAAEELAHARATIHSTIGWMKKTLGFQVHESELERAEEVYSQAQYYLEDIIEGEET